MEILLLLFGFVILIKGADLFVDGAAAIAKRFNVSSIVIGLTVVAFGTSAPEMFVNVLASINGSSSIGIGNVLGSVIVNALLVLGVCSLISPLKTKKDTVWKEIPFALMAIVSLLVMVNDYRIDGVGFQGLGRSDGVMLIFLFIIFLYYTFGISKVTSSQDFDVEIKQMKFIKCFAYLFFGLLALLIGGDFVVNGAVKVAKYFGLSEALIGLTVVAIGTSLPELVTSVVAVTKKQTDLAIGNVIGSNIFNVVWILGLNALINPMEFSEKIQIDIWVAIGASLFIFLAMFVGKRHTLDKLEGGFMVVGYILYLVFIVWRN